MSHPLLVLMPLLNALDAPLKALLPSSFQFCVCSRGVECSPGWTKKRGGACAVYFGFFFGQYEGTLYFLVTKKFTLALTFGDVCCKTEGVEFEDVEFALGFGVFWITEWEGK